MGFPAWSQSLSFCVCIVGGDRGSKIENVLYIRKKWNVEQPLIWHTSVIIGCFKGQMSDFYWSV